MADIKNFPQMKPPPIDLKNIDDKVCACGGTTFVQAFGAKPVSAVTSPTGQAGFAAYLKGLVCLDCKEMLK